MSQLNGPTTQFAVVKIIDSVGTRIIDSHWTSRTEAETRAAVLPAAIVISASGVAQNRGTEVQRLTTAEREALTPTEGDTIYDLDLRKLVVWIGSGTGQGWNIVTSTGE